MNFVKAKEVISVLKELDENVQAGIVNALKIAERIEEESISFYKKHADKNNGNELEIFFKFMVKEEEMHLKKISELQKNVSTDSKISFSESFAPKPSDTPIGKEELSVLLFAMWREKKAEEFYRQASEKTSGVVKNFFEELANFEKEHVMLIEEYIERMQNTSELIMG